MAVTLATTAARRLSLGYNRTGSGECGYNGQPYDPILNPGGMDGNGVAVNWINMCADLVTLGIITATQADIAASAADRQQAWGPIWAANSGAVTYVNATRITVDTTGTDLAVGTHVQADCGADGYKFGIVSGASEAGGVTTVDFSWFGGGALTANLKSITTIAESRLVYVVDLETPVAAATAAATTAVAARTDAVAAAAEASASEVAAAASMQAVVTAGAYARDIAWAAKGTSVAADRYTMLSPGKMTVSIGAVGFSLATQVALDLSLATSWDSTTTDYRVAANRAGKDFYVYACDNAGVLKLLVSANATYPSGYTAATSRKLGGFHCLCSAVGTISDHPLSDYVAGDILPASVWDLRHRPVSSPEGMVYVSGLGKWADIYLASVSGGALVSANGGTIADGASTPAFHWYKFSQGLGQVGKRLPTQHEFVAISLGSNQGTNIAGGADPVTTGGHADTAGRRMISNVGCEDCCGALLQWGIDAGGPYASAAWADAYDANDTGVAGQSYNAPNRGLLGGSWNAGAVCGARCSLWNSSPLLLGSNNGARGVSDPLAVGL